MKVKNFNRKQVEFDNGFIIFTDAKSVKSSTPPEDILGLTPTMYEDYGSLGRLYFKDSEVYIEWELV